MGLRKFAGCVVAVAAMVLAMAGPAHASSSPAAIAGEKVSPATLAAPGGHALDVGARSVHCGNAYFDFDGYQWYFAVSCSSTGTTQWWAVVACSDGSYGVSGPHTGFWNVQVYCSPGTTPVQAWVEYTT
ncbi:hypothetical protein FNQ90_14200 [Streptomyces alkaliphilus]|uniref:Secreted protein n=1 Tax=Streptomyces alkaliphilus TaxID=1472722 RepID=A0A7W3TE71_9ACTN|nr:hypothetical protein [Streptomyces alkaliphilus]MBB0245224.1 hypothetical protein [Streptomyces alkaliphilus]